MRVFYNAILFQVFFNIYVLLICCKAVPEKYKRWRIPLIILFGVEFIIYVIGFFFAYDMTIELAHLFTWIGTTWMVFVGYTTVLFVVFGLIRWMMRKSLKRRGNSAIQKYRIITTTISILIVILAMILGNYNFKNPQITELTIDINKSAPIDSMRVVVATDIHAGILINKNILQKYVSLINAQKPDLVLLVGDIIDFDIKSVERQRMQDELNQLKATYGVFISTGNHEYIELANEKKGAKVDWLVDSTRCNILRDEVVNINDAFYIVGREDDETYNTRLELSQIMQNVDISKPIILMNHEPVDIHEAYKNGIDMAFYGHTHNGQLFVGNLLVKIPWELAYGYKRIGDSHVYVSSGLGLAGPQYRIGTVSEIVVCNLRFNIQTKNNI